MPCCLPWTQTLVARKASPRVPRPPAARRWSPRRGHTSASCRSLCRRRRAAPRPRRRAARSPGCPAPGRSRCRCPGRSPAGLRGWRGWGGCSYGPCSIGRRRTVHAQAGPFLYWLLPRSGRSRRCPRQPAPTLRPRRSNAAPRRSRPRSRPQGWKPGEFIDRGDPEGRGGVGAGERARSRRQGLERPGLPAAPARRTVAPRSLELGFAIPRHHRHLVVLENTPAVHNVICCTLCSCTAFTMIGLPPDWYKDLEYRARVVRESRTVLKRNGPGAAARGRDPGLGHDRRHPLHRAADAAAADARLAGGAARVDRHAATR